MKCTHIHHYSGLSCFFLWFIEPCAVHLCTNQHNYLNLDVPHMHPSTATKFAWQLPRQTRCLPELQGSQKMHTTTCIDFSKIFHTAWQLLADLGQNIAPGWCGSRERQSFLALLTSKGSVGAYIHLNKVPDHGRRYADLWLPNRLFCYSLSRNWSFVGC